MELITLDLHVGKDGSTSEQSGSANGTSGHGSSVLGRIAASLGVTGGVVANLTAVLGVATSDGDGGGHQSIVAGSGRGDARSEGHIAAGRGAGVRVRGLIIGLGTIGGLRGVGRQDGVEDVQNTIGQQDVGGDDAGTVHEDFAVNDGDGHVVATESGDGAVGQRAAVGDGAIDDVV